MNKYGYGRAKVSSYRCNKRSLVHKEFMRYIFVQITQHQTHVKDTSFARKLMTLARIEIS